MLHKLNLTHIFQTLKTEVQLRLISYFKAINQIDMAPTAVTRNQLGSHPQCVQEMVQNNGDEIPERYLNSDKKIRITGDHVPLMDAPAIDMGLLASASSSGSAEELAKLRSVLTTWGCFQLVNHGMSVEFLEQVRGTTKEFFGLRQEEKQKYARAADGIEGYGTDNVYEHHTVNWNDRHHLIVYPEHQRKLQYWPQTPLHFREVVHEFTMKSREIVETLLRAMAVALNLEEKSFVKQYGEEGIMFGRFNYYPRCPRPDAVLGIKPHTDGTAVTVLLQDAQVEALQVQRDESWFRVPTLPHALFINVGDQMEIMSNGIFKSAFHKVTTNGERDRISLALLCSPEADREIGPASELVNAERPQLFNRVKDYGQIYFQIDPTDNKRPIDLLRI